MAFVYDASVASSRWEGQEAVSASLKLLQTERARGPYRGLSPLSRRQNVKEV